MGDTATRDQNKFIVRFPDGMRDRLKDQAAKNNRSMNAEIIHRLTMTLEVDDWDDCDPEKVSAGENILPSVDAVELAKALVKVLESKDLTRRDKHKVDRAARDQEALRTAKDRK